MIYDMHCSRTILLTCDCFSLLAAPPECTTGRLAITIIIIIIIIIIIVIVIKISLREKRKIQGNNEDSPAQQLCCSNIWHARTTYSS
jgi:hypothetical protein